MTLILSAINLRQSIQVVDQRLTGQSIDIRHSNKATVITCANGRFSAAYTGIATIGKFRTQRWLLDALYECGPPEFGFYEITRRFMSKAQFVFANDPDLRGLRPENKRVSFLFSGYLYRETPILLNVAITNFQDWDSGVDLPVASNEFWSLDGFSVPNAPNPTAIHHAGAWRSLLQDELDDVREMLIADKPSQAIQDKIAAVMRRAADRPAAGGTVGKDLTSVVIPSDPSQKCRARFRPWRKPDRMMFVDQMRLTPDRSIAIADVELKVAGANRIGRDVAKKPARNERCWCGSRKKFKKCHGKFKVL